MPLTAFAAGAVVALLIGVFGRVHDPTTDGTTTLGFDTVIDMKVVLTAVIGVLVVLQLIGALWIYGKLGIRAPRWLGTAHRVSGSLALLLSVFVGYHCLWALGLEYGELHNGEPVPARAVVHGVLGCVVFGAFVVKIVAVRSKRAAGLVPAAGRRAAVRRPDPRRRPPRRSGTSARKGGRATDEAALTMGEAPVRPADPSDAPALAAIAERAYAPYVPRIGIRPGADGRRLRAGDRTRRGVGGRR